MNYSLQDLTAVAECDVLLSWAAREKANLSHRKMTDEFNTNKFAQTAQEITNALMGVNAEISANNAVLATVPENSETHEEALNKQTRLTYKKFLLEERRENFGITSLIEKQVDLARTGLELSEMEQFMAAVDERRAALA
ncbi:MAG TPA: hypothetical protein VF581_06230 [Flavobacterium sp.]|jgi:hypothetical protein